MLGDNTKKPYEHTACFKLKEGGNGIQDVLCLIRSSVGVSRDDAGSTTNRSVIRLSSIEAGLMI